MPPKGSSEYGSFKDSMREPIHRWFAYPAGYSFRLVEAKVREYGLGRHSLIVDPFLGSGTTTLAAMNLGIDSMGVEAHRFVSGVARTKCFRYEGRHETLYSEHETLQGIISGSKAPDVQGMFPELIYKCFGQANLKALAGIRGAVSQLRGYRRGFFELALVRTLRQASTAGTGWPYIAPSKHAAKKARDARAAFRENCTMMLSDIKPLDRPRCRCKVVTGDSRNLGRHVPAGSADLIMTSPPYLNNYDYADRTRLETYFMGMYNTWGDITRDVREKLMVAATTQVTKGAMEGKAGMPTVREISPGIHRRLERLAGRMRAIKSTKPGKKDYDTMARGYFEDIARVIIGAEAAAKRGGHFVLVLGDSAPYGVHVETDRIIGGMAKAAGFARYRIRVLRERGEKWKGNPQRHGVPLRESIVDITK